MTPASRRTGRAAALSVAVSLATALLAAACSAPPAHHSGQGSSAGSGDTAPLLDGGIDRGIHLPGTAPDDHLNTVPDTVTPHHRHHATTETAALPPTGTAKRHPRTAHPRHARTRRRVWAAPHHRTPDWHRLHTAHHPATSTAAAPARSASTPHQATQPATQPATQQATQAGTRPAAQQATRPATRPTPAALLPAIDHRPLWIGTPAEHVAPVRADRTAPVDQTGRPTGATQPARPIPGTGDVVIPVTVPAAQGPLRPDTVLSGPGFQVDLRQRPAAPAPGTAAPLIR
jgi:hypothetical protein